jgi:Protein of unknown function (DUF2442)
MNPRVAVVVPLSNGVLQLEFQDGRRATFDTAPYVEYPVFQCLKDPAYFNRATLNHGTVAWPDGIDFDPDTLYLESHSI